MSFLVLVYLWNFRVFLAMRDVPSSLWYASLRLGYTWDYELKLLCALRGKILKGDFTWEIRGTSTLNCHTSARPLLPKPKISEKCFPATLLYGNRVVLGIQKIILRPLSVRNQSQECDGSQRPNSGDISVGHRISIVPLCSDASGSKWPGSQE